MKCNSCQENISPKMKKAVEKNLCPFCGDKIVPDELRKSLTVLDSTMEFLLQKFETETLDYIKDKYSLVSKSSLMNSGFAKRTSNSRGKSSDDMENDEDDDLESSIDDSDLSLTEKLKDKNFRKKYMLASKISGKAAVSNSDYESILKSKDSDDEPRRSHRDEEDQVDDDVDDSILRKLQSMANRKASGDPKSSDLEKLENLMAKTKKPFSPPC